MLKDKKIILAGVEIYYTLKSDFRIKRIHLKIKTNGALIVSKPIFVSQKAIEKLLEEKQTWILGKIKFFKENTNKIKVGDYLNNKLRAQELVQQRLNYFQQFYNFKVNKIFVRNQTTRWGSCSTKNNLNFNYRILYLPHDLVDYVVVHELCHLAQMNHSEKFWKLVEKQIPDYCQRRKALRQILF
jgi:hypothetical protein